MISGANLPSRSEQPASLERPQRFAAKVHTYLLERILHGLIPVGERIVELEVAAELNVSQALVREALRELEADGVTETTFYRGSRVRSISISEASELSFICASLEALAARLAAQRSPELSSRLRSIVSTRDRALQGKDQEESDLQERAFRELLVRASGSYPLIQLWQRVILQSELARQQHPKKDARGFSQKILRAIVEALEKGDGSRAGRLLSGSYRPGTAL